MERAPDDLLTSLTTVLVEPEELAADELEIGGAAYRHLFRARRLRTGDLVRAVDGEGRARWGRVAAVGRSGARLALSEIAPSRESERRVELLVAAPRPQRAGWLVEKATELGVAAVRFLGGERAPRRYGAATLARFERMARAALEQSHRSCLPELSGVHRWSEVAPLIGALEVRWLLDPAAAQTPAPGPAAASVAVVVGPEGGWTEGEKGALLRAGCSPVRLGDTVLRVETAALVGAAWALLSGGD